MKKPSMRQSVWNLYTWGIEVCEGLAFFSETAELGAAFRAVVDGLRILVEERPPLELAFIPLRAKVRFADFTWDMVLRSFAKDTEIADGGKRGSLHAAIFPNTVSALTAPSGAGQIAPAEGFLTRLSASKVPGIEPLRSKWQPKLQAALDGLKSAVAGREQAYTRLTDLFIREQAAKEDLDISIEKLMGQVRTAFPKDPTRWDAIFPSQKTSASSPAEPEQSAAAETQ